MTPKRIVWLFVGVYLLVALGRGAGGGHQPQGPDDVPSEVAAVWFDQLYDLVTAEQITPPPASRIYGLAAVALYEAVVLGSQSHRPLAGQLNGWPLAMDTSLAAAMRARLPPEVGEAHAPPETAAGQAFLRRRLNWPTVANSALARVVRGLFPTLSPGSLAAITAVEQAFAAEGRGRVPGPVYTRSVVWGRVVAEAVLAWAATDGSATLSNCPYTPPVGPGLWEPTSPAFAPPLEPCWGRLRPLVLAAPDACPPPPPPADSDDPASAFYAFGLEVYTTSVTLTEEQRTIAQYWVDNAGATGTPPGHWIAIVGQLARTEGLSLMAAAEGYARVGLAVHDAFIGCWHAKYAYHLQRPVTYINDHLDQSWQPYLVTPNFPSYTSGHSTQSGAAAHVLTDMFGRKRFTDTTHTDHDLMPPQEPRTFDSFEEAAAEAAVSRLYGGIHFAFDNDHGLASGHCIGQALLDRVQFTRDDEKRPR